jgi:D-alanine transaminase
MSIVFLNQKYIPLEEARISPMDRGFLFGDGIYEVLPTYHGQIVGFDLHINRLNKNMSEVGIKLKWTNEKWLGLCRTLIKKNGSGNLGIYIHVSRGKELNRSHSYKNGISPTIYAFSFKIPAEHRASKSKIIPYKVNTSLDLRWSRCQIKSTALLGNIMHFQKGYQEGFDETLLFNDRNELREGTTCNAYIVKDRVVITPPLDNHILPGVTRYILLDLLSKESSVEIQERVVTKDEVYSASEVWVSSSSKGVIPVVEVDGNLIGNGDPGDIWLLAQTVYSKGKKNY